MLFQTLTDEQKKDIACQIAELIDTFTSEGKLGGATIPPGLSLFESCREAILDLPRQWAEILHATKSDRIEQWRRQKGVTWYHQLRAADEVFGFARSIEVNRPGGLDHRVIEVVPSTVAQEFQSALGDIDAEEPSDLGMGESPAVLLHVPRYGFYGLATEEKNTITLTYPFFRERLDVGERRLERESLLTVLKRLPSTFGASGMTTGVRIAR